MEIKPLDVVRAPEGGGRSRLSAEITYQQDGATEICWYEIDDEVLRDAPITANPWLASCLPIAASLGEPLVVRGPVDPILLENARGLLQIWKHWYPRVHDVPIEAETVEPSPPSASPSSAGRQGAFFSGGVDSFFSLLRHEQASAGPARAPVDDLICIFGFDIPLSKPDDFARLWSRYQEVADRLGKRLVRVATNLRDTRYRAVEWGFMGQGAALASVGLCLAHRFDRILIGSTYGYRNPWPWGTHPLTDPLFSSGSTRFVHDGAAFDRVEKTRLVLTSEAAMDVLRVCAISRSSENCSACHKCVRTLAAFDLFDSLDQARTFDREKYSLARLAAVYSENPRDRSYIVELRDWARKLDRPDLARAAEASLARSARLRPWVAVADYIGKKPFIWRWSGPLERWLVAK